MKKNIKSYVFSYISYIITAIGMSLSIKAAIGVSSVSAISLSFSDLTEIKVGTITMIINFLFLFGYAYLTRFKLWMKYVIQFITVLFFGVLINFFVYDILVLVELTNYFQRLILLIIGTTIGGISVGVIMSLDVITYPIESFCHELSVQRKSSFLFIRYGVDIIAILISLLISLLFTLPYVVREGTLINTLILAFVMNYTKLVIDHQILKHKKIG